MADDQVRLVVAALRDLSSNVVKRLTLECTANLIEATPVDTGWARANWVPNVGVSIDGLHGSGEEISRGERTALVGAARTRQQAHVAGIAATYDIRRGPVYISNGVPYVSKLNEGSSAQAPAGFVQAAIDRAVNTALKGLATE